MRAVLTEDHGNPEIITRTGNKKVIQKSECGPSPILAFLTHDCDDETAQKMVDGVNGTVSVPLAAMYVFRGLTPSTKNMLYVRLPAQLRRDTGGCQCDACVTPGAQDPSKWDCLAIDLKAKRTHHATWVIHYPWERLLQDRKSGKLEVIGKL